MSESIDSIDNEWGQAIGGGQSDRGSCGMEATCEERRGSREDRY